ncbi:MAG: 3'-5' exonuclease, partial [Candidatus Omnitrophota bacterium]|nr:3'-5' exonuclease [Candidatus Omnitrophota bacterium]
MLAILKALFTQFNHYGLDYRDSPVGSAELIKLRHTVLKNIKNLHSELDGDNIDKRFINSLDNFVKTHDTSFDIDTLSSYFEREDLPVKKGGKAPDRLHKAWDKIRKDLKRICEDEAFSLFNPYVHIFQQALAAFETIATKEDVLFLEELNRKASQLFKQGDISVGELYYRLATRFRHYLLDEFQDTSRLQWKNIEPMASEALASGGSLFYVGDKKQAIYDFRGGDVELFDEIRTGLKDYNVQLETLTKNWRSQKEVVEFNNAVFSAENLRGFISRKEAFEAEKKKKGQVVFSEEDLTVVEQAFGNSLQTCKNENTGGYVKVEHLDVDKKDERDEALRERIVPLIKDLSRRFTLSDIAILTRNNKEVERVTGWLLAENIFVESERTSNVRENPVIQEIVSLLKFLNSPIDNLSFAQFLLGESFRKANGDMFPSPKGTGTCPQNMHDFLFSIRPRIKGEKDFYIYMAFREQYPEQWQGLFEEFFKNVGLYPMYEMTVSIYNRFQLLKNFPEYQGFLMRFLELIKREEEDHSDIASFLEYFDELEGDDLFVHVTDTEAVKVLTVHKSKGLEFPVVILPFLGMNVQVGEGAGDNQQSYVLQKEADSVRLLRLKSKYYNYSDELYAIYAREYKKNFLSELNNIYVALTRPQYELYVFLSNKVGQHHNPAR